MAAAATLGDDLRKLLTLVTLSCTPLSMAATQVVIVEGLGGTSSYAVQFAEQVDAVEAAARTLAPEPTIRVFRADDATRDGVIGYFAQLAGSMAADDLLIVYLIGYGSYDDREYKFNIAGPDLTDTDILTALDELPDTNQVVVNTSSASGAAATLWEKDSRIVITATRSGTERHATRFGSYFVAALNDPAADLDKNDIVSAQEAFDFADRRVQDFFESDGRLATEHARMSGERAERVSLARLSAARALTDDALLRELVAERDAIAERADQVRFARDRLPPDEYQQQLLDVMLQLAEAEEAIERREAEIGQP